MPLYEFQCQSCGTVIEKLMKISDQNPKDCESCNDGVLKKLMSRTHFVLKGSGWYETDFKDKKPNNDKKSSASPSKKIEKKSESVKSDSEMSTKSANVKSAAQTQCAS